MYVHVRSLSGRSYVPLEPPVLRDGFCIERRGLGRAGLLFVVCSYGSGVCVCVCVCVCNERTRIHPPALALVVHVSRVRGARY